MRRSRIASVFGPMLPTVGGRVTHALLVLLFLVIAAFSFVLCWALPRQDRLARERAVRLRTAEGVVDSTSVRKAVSRKSGHTSWKVRTSYSFELDGRRVNGSRFTFDESSRERSFGFEDEARAFQARFPEGARAAVWYDPLDPRDSGLDPFWTPVAGYAFPAAAVGAFSLLVAVLGARAALREARRQPLAPDVVVRALQKVRLVSALVAGAATLLLAIHFAPIAAHDLFVAPRLASAEAWPHGDLDVHGSPPTPVVSYTFRPEGDPVLRDGAAWRFGRQAVRTLEEAEAVRDRLRDEIRAGRLRVHFSRSDPGTSALSKGHGGVLPHGLLVVGCVALLLAAPAAVVSARALRTRPRPPSGGPEGDGTGSRPARRASARPSRTVR